jgi:hypothetical protein
MRWCAILVGCMAAGYAVAGEKSPGNDLNNDGGPKDRREAREERREAREERRERRRERWSPWRYQPPYVHERRYHYRQR